MPAQGTPESLILSVKPGACFETPRLRSTRPVEYRPEFSDDIAAMISTPFITLPTQPRPIAPNTETNGLVFSSYCEVGSIATSSRIDPT